MESSITCEKCGNPATVIHTRYIYDRQPTIDDDTNLSLRETEYEIDCPQCGRVAQTVRAAVE